MKRVACLLMTLQEVNTPGRMGDFPRARAGACKDLLSRSPWVRAHGRGGLTLPRAVKGFEDTTGEYFASGSEAYSHCSGGEIFFFVCYLLLLGRSSKHCDTVGDLQVSLPSLTCPTLRRHSLFLLP